MAEELTPQQKIAVQNRGGKLLVSAAAGSGKTKVLVDRLMSYVLDPQKPANLDDFLIITYTKAAAAELRVKIGKKLSEWIAQMPENRHLQQQMQRLYLTKISTVHSFCGDILREYAYLLDLPADFRLADENECLEMRNQCIDQLLNQVYEELGQNTDVHAFLDTQGQGRTDDAVPKILLKVFDSAQCHLDPQKWLDDCTEAVQLEGITDAGQTVWGKYLMEELFSYLDDQIIAMEACAAQADGVDTWGKQAALLHDTVYQLRKLRACSSWDALIRKKNIDYGRLIFPRKNTLPELEEQIKAVRGACQSGLNRRLKPFANESSQVLADLEQTAPAVRGLVWLVRRFGELYQSAKRSRRVMDFSDLEHRTLDLLTGKKRSFITLVAREIGSRFLEIMVDEYQDSNQVQDAIFNALTMERQNLFMVGDVKQSIYQFRLADPGIFLEKYATFVDADEAAEGQGRKVSLSYNFRSNGGVIAGVNHVFATCMSPRIGGLVYGPDEALQEGTGHISLGEPEVELHGIQVTQDKFADEASFVADRIRQLLDGTHMVAQGKALRPITAEDIVILLRSPKHQGRYFRKALEDRGIPVATAAGRDLLKTVEISTLQALLQVISNPRQDIPLLAVLMSPVFGFTADEVAQIRSGKKYITMYEALLQADTDRVRDFLAKLQHLRMTARMRTLTQLVQQILLTTRLDSIFSAMSDGQERQENLQQFYQLCADFEATAHRDLEQFLDHLQQLEKKGISVGESANNGAVTIMSIHKSKGLEFPVVFLSGLSSGFNSESSRDQVLCHKELGLGLVCVNNQQWLRYPTISKRAIAAKIQAEGLSEEMRILYVAMTRARDRLIMTYAADNLENDLSQIAKRLNLGGKNLLLREATCCGDWILLAAMQRTDAGAFFQIGGKPDRTQVCAPPWYITVQECSAAEQVQTVRSAAEPQLQEAVIHRLKESLAFQYPHLSATQAPSKQTATQRKGRDKDREIAQGADSGKEIFRQWRKPSFLSEEKQGRDYGNAMHSALQYIRYEACSDEAAIRQEIGRLVQQRFLTPEQGELVNYKKLAAFFASGLGRRLRAQRQILREFKFSILDDAGAYSKDLEGEQVLLQGVVDCALLESDGITIVDFKTDYVTQQTLSQRTEHYRPQVEAYAMALSRIFDLPVKRKALYYFHIDSFVDV